MCIRFGFMSRFVYFGIDMQVDFICWTLYFSGQGGAGFIEGEGEAVICKIKRAVAQ